MESSYDYNRCIEMLVRNTDENGKEIITFPFPNPLLSLVEVAAREAKNAPYFSLTSLNTSFSANKFIQSQLQELVDLPKWNETTLLAKFHETVAHNLGGKILRSSDVARRVIQRTDWGEILLGNADCLHKIQTNIHEYSSSSNEDNKERDTWNRMNASLFFTLLFTDAEFDALLEIEDKILIGNALTIATWKERMECDIFKHPEIGPILDQSLQYSEESEQNKFFKRFILGEVIKMGNTEEMIHALQISPWCGFEAVMVRIRLSMISKHIDFNRRKMGNGRMLRECLLYANLNTNTMNDQFLNTVTKRIKEDQYFLVKILAALLSSTLNNELGTVSVISDKDKDFKKIVHEIEQLTHANVAIDTQGGIELYTQYGLEFLDGLRHDPKVQEEMNKINGEMSEYLSNTIAGVVSKTGEKLVHKSMHYFIFLPFVFQLIRTWRSKGMFASLQYAMESTWKTIKDRLLPLSKTLRF